MIYVTGDISGALVEAVFLDGFPQRSVLLADTTAGFVERFKRDLDGALVFDHEAGEYVTETVAGVVTVSIKPGRAELHQKLLAAHRAGLT
jgi:hypothetical protein